MNPYIGEIRMFGGDFAPVGWAFCKGQLLAIAEHEALFDLLGTTYGGDGQTTFALPDLQGRIPVHRSSQHPMRTAEVETTTAGSALFAARADTPFCEDMPPFLCESFIIALEGVLPSHG